jgi:hypothetical protein
LLPRKTGRDSPVSSVALIGVFSVSFIFVFDFSVFGLVGQGWRGDRTRAGWG